MKKSPVRAVLVHTGSEAGSFYKSDGSFLKSPIFGRVKGYREIYLYQPDFRYPSPHYLFYPKYYLSYILNPAEDTQLQALLSRWDEGEAPINSREECHELTVRLSDKSKVNLIVRRPDHPRLREHLEWLSEHRSERPITEFKAEQIVCFGRAIDYRIGMTSVGGAKPNSRVGAEVAAQHGISVAELQDLLKPYVSKKDLP